MEAMPGRAGLVRVHRHHWEIAVVDSAGGGAEGAQGGRKHGTEFESEINPNGDARSFS